MVQYKYKKQQYKKEVQCPDCKQVRYITASCIRLKTFTGRCYECMYKWRAKNMLGINHPNWKGGKSKSWGYIVIRINKDNPYFDMCTPTPNGKSGYVREHRLVMAKEMGRPLIPTELVHHINGVRSDNRVENLCITERGEHEHRTFIKILQKKIRQLEEQIDHRGEQD